MSEYIDRMGPANPGCFLDPSPGKLAFYGGLSQVIVGIMCFKRGDTFGTTSFTSYGLFWLSLVGLSVMPHMGLPASPASFMGWYLALWGIFTGFMFIGSLCYPTAKQIVFGSLTILFFLLAARDFTGSEFIGTIAGFEGIFCGASSIYFAMAQVLKNEFGREVLPVGKAKIARKVDAVATA